MDLYMMNRLKIIFFMSINSNIPSIQNILPLRVLRTLPGLLRTSTSSSPFRSSSWPFSSKKFSKIPVLGRPRPRPGPRSGRPRPPTSHENLKFAVLGRPCPVLRTPVLWSLWKFHDQNCFQYINVF